MMVRGGCQDRYLRLVLYSAAGSRRYNVQSLKSEEAMVRKLNNVWAACSDPEDRCRRICAMAVGCAMSGISCATGSR
jgi:hypothetical protein